MMMIDIKEFHFVGVEHLIKPLATLKYIDPKGSAYKSIPLLPILLRTRPLTSIDHITNLC